MSVMEITAITVAPPARKEYPDEEQHCETCDCITTDPVWSCGACGEWLELDPTTNRPWWHDTDEVCTDCGLDYSNTGEHGSPVYLSPNAMACLTAKDDTVTFNSRKGWCYLPHGHKSNHYYLTDKDL